MLFYPLWSTGQDSAFSITDLKKGSGFIILKYAAAFHTSILG